MEIRPTTYTNILKTDVKTHQQKIQTYENKLKHIKTDGKHINIA